MASGDNEPSSPVKGILNGAKKMYYKSSIIVSAICVLGGLGYAIWTKNTDLVTFLAGAGIGYLLKDVQTEPT